MSKKKTLNDIFDDDEFGILDSKNKISNNRSSDVRLLESFNLINEFYEQNNREPKSDVFVVSERSLGVTLNEIKKDHQKVEILKAHDKYNLLVNTDQKLNSINDIIDDDDLGLLDTDDTSEIFKLKHIPLAKERQETDYFSRRKKIKDFEPYEELFKEVHKDIKEGKRKIINYNSDNLQEGAFYILDGILMLFEKATIEVTKLSANKSELDGRTKCIFENATTSDMKYRSLKKALSMNGSVVTHKSESNNDILAKHSNLIIEDDLQTGWIYILKSLSNNEKIKGIPNLYKIGFSKIDVDERIKNASKEPTYLMADVKIVTTFKCFNLNPHKFEQLLHRFFSEVCLNIDIFEKGKRLMPREWFVVPLPIITEVVELIISGEVVRYKYDRETATIILL